MSQMNIRSLITSPAHACFRLVSLVLAAFMVYLLAGVMHVQAQPQGWSTTGSLATGRGRHTTIVLANGKVLVVGGIGAFGMGVRIAELYDPLTREWIATGSLKTLRVHHIAVRLANGKVLVAGGSDGATTTHWEGAEITAEIYDPDTGAWSAAGNLNVRRAGHTANLLADGRVLVTGGYFGGNTAEVYDPATDAWSPTGTMNSPRAFHTATLLPDGRVLVVGGMDGDPLRSAELFDPGTGSWTAIGDLTTPHVSHTATLLPNGNVLVVGGGGRGNNYPLRSSDGIDQAELYDPPTGQWRTTGSLTSARGAHTTTLLHNGSVLVVGGSNDGQPANTVELYDVATGSWSITESLNTARYSHTATLLPSGNVLVTGGSPPYSGVPDAELYNPGFEIPLLTLNSASYCVGDPWSLMVVRSARATSVQLSGVSNGASWAIARWGATDQAGSFSASGIMAGGTEGTHALSVEIGGIRSEAVSFAVSKCP